MTKPYRYIQYLQSYKVLWIFILALIGVGIFAIESSRQASALNIVNGSLPYATAIALGEDHSCALTNIGGVKCWGGDYFGQLGDGSTLSSLTPVDVNGLETGVKAIDSSKAHTCALLNDNRVKCWGWNIDGQLGDGSLDQRNTPVSVAGLSGTITQLAVGHFHTCALNADGFVQCWGKNLSGQLGDGTAITRTTPITVNLNVAVLQVAAGSRHTCAITESRGVKCWGNNSAGQLGISDTTHDYLEPVDVPTITDVQMIVAGEDHTCAVTTSQAMKCWGQNQYGQLGDGSTNMRTTPVDVSGLSSGVMSITAGFNHTCAILNDGTVQCWGLNEFGQLGNGSTENRSAASNVQRIEGKALAISAGRTQTCALTTTGTKCWGGNNFGQLGDGNSSYRTLPTFVENLPDSIQSVGAGDLHTCALTVNGTVKCWGRNYHGQLGNGLPGNQSIPLTVTGLISGVTQLAVGWNHNCAVTAQGAVKCWGWNEAGQLGDGSTLNRTTPINVSTLSSGVKRVAAGAYHTCALMTTGAINCWGANYRGQLGNNSTTASFTPVAVLNIGEEVVDISLGEISTCAKTLSGKIFCWGDNRSGQLGIGNTTDSWVPVEVPAFSSLSATAINVDARHACAVAGGSASCWGLNASGQLGDGTTFSRTVPTNVTDLNTNIVDIDAGQFHACALKQTGSAVGAKCWGLNSSGQLGDTTLTQRFFPVDVSGLSTGVNAISAGGNHTCALLESQRVKCWGRNDTAQLGINPGWFPVSVVGLDAPPPTPTLTPTPTVPTLTSTSTPTITPTPTVPTLTSTPTPTITPTPSVPTLTSTSTPTITPTPSVPTLTSTSTSTQTPTPTVPTLTPTPTLTQTPITQTPTSTSTPTLTTPSSYTVNLPLVANQPAAPSTPTQTWQQVSTIPRQTDSFVIHDGKLFVAERSDNSSENGLYRSQDCAINSIFTRLLAGAAVYDVVFRNTRGLIATKDQGVWFSSDSGENWTKAQIDNPNGLSVVFIDDNLAYAGTNSGGLYRSNDGGTSWSHVEPANGLGPKVIQDLTYDQTSNTLWLATFGEGLWKLTPGSTQFVEVNNGLTTPIEARRIYDVALNAGQLYLATGNGVYKGDGINAWSPIGLQGLPILSVTKIESQLYAGTRENGMKISRNEGQTWEQENGLSPALTIRDLFYDTSNTCKDSISGRNGFLAATSLGIWVNR